jgi:hypothetical protein
MPTITAADVQGHTMYAKSNVDLLDKNFHVKDTLSSGALIGDVYSYTTDSNGNMYWMFYRGTYDFDQQNPTYVLNDTNKLDLPSYNDLLDAVTQKIEADKLQSMGTINYYLQKYFPYIIGAGVVAIVLPSILKNQKNISGMEKKKDNSLLYIVGGAAAIYLLSSFKAKPKLKGSIEIGPLDKGIFVPDVLNLGTTPDSVDQNNGSMVNPLNIGIPLQTMSINPAENNQLMGKQINYVGPFEVSYQGGIMAGKRKRTFVI